jgi:urease subunit alpha
MLCQPALFGIRPTVVFKGGMAAVAALGDPTASVPTRQPASADTSVAFASQRPSATVRLTRCARRPLIAVGNVPEAHQGRPPGQLDAARVEGDPGIHSLRVNGELIEHDPATELPMAQRYFLF